MQIACPNCSTSYEVDATTIGAAGRPVRCVRCRAIWDVPPPKALSTADAVAQKAPAASDENVAAFQQELGGGSTGEPALSAPPQPSAGPPVAITGAPHDIETVAAAAAEADHPVELATEAKPAAAADEAVTIADAPPLVPELPSEPPPPDGTPGDAAEPAPRRRHRARRPPPKPSGLNRLLACVSAGLLVVIGGLIGWRAEVVRHAPQMASLYSTLFMTVNLRKLVFTEVRLAKEAHDGVPVFLVEGTIASTSPKPVEIPRLRFAIRNAAGAEIYFWTAPPPQPKLEPFEQLAFSSRLATPPGDGRDIVVRFLSRHDATADSK